MKDNNPTPDGYSITGPGHINCKCVPSFHDHVAFMKKKQTATFPVHFEPGALEKLHKLFEDEVESAYAKAELDKPMKLLRIVDKWIHVHLGCKRTDATNDAVVWIASKLRAGALIVIKAEQLEKM